MKFVGACHSMFLALGKDSEDLVLEFLATLQKIIETGCRIEIDPHWHSHQSNSQSLLNYDAKYKETFTLLWTILGKLPSGSEDWPCGCESVSDSMLALCPMQENHDTLCGETNVQCITVKNLDEFQEYWRMIATKAKCGDDLDLCVPGAFMYLEFSVEKRDWEKMGPPFTAIISSLVDHLSYLNDLAVLDWAAANFNDAEFEIRARVSLSRESGAALHRPFSDAQGNSYNCRHHTKLTPNRGGRIYFAIENRSQVFVGKVCEHL